jgi:dTDP-4-amino-4,6-dideoxygalactose transaminase
VSVPFFDRTRADAAQEAELTAVFQRLLRSGQYILGRELAAFEEAAAAYLGVPHALGVSCGTDALVIALSALDLAPGDEVLCPAYTFFATAGAILRAGGTPALCDVDPLTYLLDPAAVAARRTARTRALVPVHLFGAPLDPAVFGGREPVVEDGAQAFGAWIGDRRAGALGAFGCFSFFPTKNLGGFGDGGLVVTSDPALAARARALRVHGTVAKHEHHAVGGNYRLDALQAALLAVKLRDLDGALAARRRLAARYAEQLAGLPLVLPAEVPGATFNQYVVRVPGEGVRDRLRAHLTARGVGTEIYYPRPLHLQPALAFLGHGAGDFPHAEAASRETLALPIFPELREDEVEVVGEGIAAFFRG